MKIDDLARAEVDYLTAKEAHLAARAAVATAFGAYAEADAAGDAAANELYRAWHAAALVLQTAYAAAVATANAALAAADAAEAKAQAAADAALAANANYAADAPKADWETATTAHDAALDAFVNAQARTRELLRAYEAADAVAGYTANLSRPWMLDAAYRAAEAYDTAFEQLAALREAREEALMTACAAYYEHLTSAKRPHGVNF